MPLPIIITAALWTAIRQTLFHLINVAVAYTSFETVAYIYEKIVDGLRDEMRVTGGLNEEETDLVMENETLKILAQIGVTVVLFRFKVGSRLAQKLGIKTGTTTTKTPQKESVRAGAERKLSAKSLSPSQNKYLQALLVSLVASIPWLPQLIQGFGDQATFASKKANDFYERLIGTRPFPEASELESPGRFTPAEFSDYARGLEAAGIKGIEYGFPKGTYLYSRDELARLIEMITGQEEGKGKPATLAIVKTLVSPYLIGINKSSSPVTTSPPTSTTTSTKPVSQATTTAKVTVFTGVVSQGTLGNGIVFSPRSNDMIDDVNELVQSASVNLANFLTALPSRVIYEIKIVPSITTKDGFTQRGSTNQIQVGTYSTGAPKYKTVTNKFAILNLYLLTDKGTKSKIATINVGPVNAVNFQVTATDLDAVADRLKGVVTTSDISEIKTIVSDSPIAVTPTTEAKLPLPNYNISAKVPGDLGYAFYRNPGDKSNPPRYVVVPDYKFYDTSYSRITEEEYRRATDDKKDYTNSGYYLDNGVFSKATTYSPSDINPPATQQQLAKANLPWSGSLQATSIAFFYDPEGKKYPSVAERALLYEQYGLGSKTLYIGSTEQNIQLLAKLKGF